MLPKIHAIPPQALLPGAYSPSYGLCLPVKIASCESLRIKYI